MDNYEISRDRAQAFFLDFDQEEIIRNWNLSWDGEHIYVPFLGEKYAVIRETGEIFRMRDGSRAGFSEVLSIFDFLCHAGSGKYPAGSYAAVNSLHGAPRAAGVGTDFHSTAAAFFDKHPDAFRAACTELGGISVDMGDIGYQFPVYAELRVILKFYHSDEDFPASITLLWDKNLLKYIYYETVFYIAGFLLDRIMERCTA